jgi:ribosomal protein S18 acetylase RimI-like enzyme
MRIHFRPIPVEDYPLAEQFKRDTTLAVNGSDALFDVWFPPERSYAAFVARTQAFDPDSCVFLLVDDEIAGGLHLCISKDGSGYLNNIYLKPEWRGQRLGDHLDAYAVA